MGIRVLPELLVNRIAAGEVIVRPASVVKELLENAIDAGASTVTIELANGCRDLTVRDDGKGFAPEDAPLALVRHATSKIENFDDLYDLATRGFRGEALASIASVARVQILSRQPQAVAGIRIVAEGPGEPRIEQAGAPAGTEIRVRELFFNTPPRLKFLKSPSAELNQVLQMVTRQAFIRPDIGFVVQNEKGRLLDLPSAQDWADRVVALLGGHTREHLLDVNEERHGVHITGFVLRPAASRKDRRHQFFFINGRPVTSRSLSFVLQEAYRGIIMVQRYPVCVLNITLPPGEVDINVHPTKEEVRFRSESLVNGVLHRVVHARLQRANLMPMATFDETAAAGTAQPGADALSIPTGQTGATPPVTPINFHAQPMQHDMLPDMGPRVAGAESADGGDGIMPLDFRPLTRAVPGVQLPARQTASLESQARADREFNALAAGAVYRESAQMPASAVPAEDAPGDVVPDADPGLDCSVRPLQSSLRQAPDRPEDAVNYALLRDGVYPEPLGQIARCYILAQMGHDLLIIDQHAAHERLMYLRFSKRKSAPPTQPLLVPVSVDVPATAMGYMDRVIPILEGLGLQVDHFGGQTYLVQTVPADMPHMNVAAVIGDLLDEFEALGKVEEVDIIRDRVITRMACRAAIKSGDLLHIDEMRALIRDIANARLGFTCPHGRPTMVLMTRDQLDKQFKRIV